MEDRRDVEDPTRQIGGDGVRNPHHQTADTDDGDTPERCPVIELLPVGPAIERRPRAPAEEPLEHGEDVLEVLQAGDQRVRAADLAVFPVAPDADDDAEQVPEEPAGEDHSIDPVADRNSVEKGKSQSACVHLGGRRIITKTTILNYNI